MPTSTICSSKLTNYQTVQRNLKLMALILPPANLAITLMTVVVMPMMVMIMTMTIMVIKYQTLQRDLILMAVILAANLAIGVLDLQYIHLCMVLCKRYRYFRQKISGRNNFMKK